MLAAKEVSMDFKIGDVVKLKSGGPLMTVNGTKGDDVWCRWFGGERGDEPKSFCFKSGELEK